MKNWKVPGIILVLLIMAMVLRWGSVSSSTNNGIVTKTLVDRWSGTIWQETIKNGSYNEKIVNQSWFEASRAPIEKQVEVSKPILQTNLPSEYNTGSKYDLEKYNIFNPKYEKVIETIHIPPPPIYWLSRNGLTKIWGWIMMINIIWLLYAVIKVKRKDENNPINI